MVAEDASAGGKVTCPSCSGTVIVPDRSEEGVFLLRGPEGSSTVVTVRQEEAARRLAAGELKADHPVWHEGNWVGLADRLRVSAPPQASASASPPADDGGELEEVFGPLKPIDLNEPPPEPAGPPPAAASPAAPRSRSGGLKYGILVLIILGAGGFIGHRLKLFDKVKLPAGLLAGLPGSGGLTGADLGNPKIRGHKSGGSSAMTITAAGSDIWGQNDECFFAHRPASGNLTLVVHVDSLTETHEWSKAGLMLREDLTGGGREVSLVVTPRNGAALQVREAPKAESRSTVKGGGMIKAPYWLKLERSGNVFRGLISKDGAAWEPLGEYPLALKADLFAGLCLTSHDVGKAATATFSAFALTPMPSPGARPGSPK